MKKKKIFFDLDGTLARFHEEDWQDGMFKDGFFKILKPYKEFTRVVNSLASEDDFEVFVLSAAPTEQGVYDKKVWTENNLPSVNKDNVIVMISDCKTTKPEYVRKLFGKTLTKDDIIVDDYNVNLVQWEEAGGTAIKAVNDFNNKKHIAPHWDGKVYDIFSGEESLHELLSNI